MERARGWEKSINIIFSKLVGIWVICAVLIEYQYSSVQFSCSAMSDSLRPHELQHTRLPCPSPSPGICSDSCALSQWSSHLTLWCPLLLNLPQHHGLRCTRNFTLSYNHLPSYKLLIASNCCRLLHGLNICKDFWMCFHSATVQTADFNPEVHKFLLSNT